MDFNSDDFRDQLEAILFKIKTGFLQVIRLLGSSAPLPAFSRLALILPQNCGRSIPGSFS